MRGGEAFAASLSIARTTYHCSQTIALSADPWPDHVRLSDLERRFVCKVCGNPRRRYPAGFQLEQKARTRDGLSLVPWSTPESEPRKFSVPGFLVFRLYCVCAYGQIYGTSWEAQRR